MNINDYLIWRGDLPFSLYGFNEVDSLILSRFSYLPFDKITISDGDKLSEISSKMSTLKDDYYKIIDDKELIVNLGNSIRYKDLTVSDLILNKSIEAEKQFGAITIHLDDFIYVSYIGTDNSIVGWKEDFNMSFMKNVPAQIEGVKYLNNIASKYSDKIWIGGHSKGGNVAIYSALYCNKKIIDRIIKVDNFDGPGFEKSVIANGNKVLAKVNTYIPQGSVIGRLLEHDEKVYVVNSHNKGILQHDIYSWEIIKDKFVLENKITGSSEIVNLTIRQWLTNTTPQNRKLFVDAVFELLYSSNSESFRELSKTWTKDIPEMVEAYSEISKEDKKNIIKMLKEFGKAFSSAFKEESKYKWEEILKRNN